MSDAGDVKPLTNTEKFQQQLDERLETLKNNPNLSLVASASEVRKRGNDPKKNVKKSVSIATTHLSSQVNQGKVNTSRKPSSILSKKSLTLAFKESASSVTSSIALPTSKSQDPIKSTFGDIILYNDEGKPYIDVNRLVYHPKERVKKELKERFSWYFADYIFIISNFLSLVCSAFLLCLGTAAVTWPTSIKSINENEGDPIILKVSSEDLSPEIFGLILITTGVLNGINVMLGIFACFFGYKILLVQHVVVDLFILGIEFGTATVFLAKGRCDDNDIQDFQDQFEGLIRNFTRPHQAKDAFDLTSEETEEFYAAGQINDIQISMLCCGASNWTDYLNPRVIQNTSRVGTLDGSEMVFPFSCCRAWWVRNLHCAEGVHLWAYPGVDEETALKFRERIHQVGCVETVWLACDRLIYLLGSGLIFNGIFNSVLVALETFSVVLQVRSLNTMLREMKSLKEPNKLGEKVIGEEDIVDESFSSIHGFVASGVSLHKEKLAAHYVRSIDDVKGILALPTEEEIQFIKSRTAFAKFESATKRTEIGRMMTQVRNIVSAEPLYDIDVPELKQNLVLNVVEPEPVNQSFSTYGRRKKIKHTHRKPKKLEPLIVLHPKKKYHLGVPSHLIINKSKSSESKKFHTHHTKRHSNDEEPSDGVPVESTPDNEDHDHHQKHLAVPTTEILSVMKFKKHSKKKKNKKSHRAPDTDEAGPSEQTNSITKNKKRRKPRKPEPEQDHHRYGEWSSIW